MHYVYHSILCLATQSCLTLWDPHGLYPASLFCPWDSPGKNTGVGCHALLQGIFPTQGPNPGLLHCRQILYRLSHQGSPRILEWVAYPLSRGTSWPRNQTLVSCIAGRLFTISATREAQWINEWVHYFMSYWWDITQLSSHTPKLRPTGDPFKSRCPKNHSLPSLKNIPEQSFLNCTVHMSPWGLSKTQTLIQGTGVGLEM